jgi:hypothetical protein
MTTSAFTTAPYHELTAAVRGSLILPGDTGYDQARAVYNAMIDKRPAAIARCRDTADVIACVRFAREVAVGTALAGGPPHRSQRALLTHWAPASGTSVKPHLGVGM